MKELILLIDGSVNPQLKVGYGAYLLIQEKDQSIDSLKDQVKVKRFEDTSSTKLELENLLWALKEIRKIGQKVIIYTDSQNIIGLAGRRERFEKNNYKTSKNKLINNYKLYQEFYSVIDQMECEFVKVSGHKASHRKDYIDRLFTIVDRASRNALRNEDQTNE